jgi:hypothetical protein
MNSLKLIERYKGHLKTLRNSNDEAFGNRYIKDKLSRLRRLLTFVDAKTLCNINEKNFLDVCDEIIEGFPQKYPTKSGSPLPKYGDYLVIVRQIYEMNTNNPAPRYAHYCGLRLNSQIKL